MEMEKEHQILNYLQGEAQTTQRQIASGTGLSLGTVNILLKKMVTKGLVKIERLNTKTLRYILTPQGFAEKSRLTYRFIKYSYDQIKRVTVAIEDVVNNTLSCENEELFLYGPQNEVLEVLYSVLNKGRVSYTYIADVRFLPEPSPRTAVIVWDLTDEDNLSASYRTINILKVLN